ncbi:MAG: hypothetical protein IPO45_11820 [Saprospiraceae bacterium]|nr:hypothetical protein [Candidatus Brachybacter algidus]
MVAVEIFILECYQSTWCNTNSAHVYVNPDDGKTVFDEVIVAVFAPPAVVADQSEVVVLLLKSAFDGPRKPIW